jgi:hypothetical protein
MKISKTKKFILAGALLAVVGGSGAAYAATAASPAEILSDLTGKSTEQKRNPSRKSRRRKAYTRRSRCHL